MKNAIIISFLLIAINTFSQIPKDIVWQQIYGTSEDVMVEDLLETYDAFYILSTLGFHGGSHDIILTKTNLLGEKIWEKRYGGTYGEYGASLIEDDKGMIYFSGTTASNDGDVQSGNNGASDFWVVKVDINGDIIWEKTFGGSMSEYLAFMTYLDNGNILLYGKTFSHDFDIPMTYGSYDFWIWEITQEGELVNDRVFGSSMMDNVYSIIQTRDGGFLVNARAGMNDGLVEGDNNQEDVWLLKLNRNLSIEWQSVFGGSHRDMGGHGIVELENGYLVSGITHSHDGDVLGYYLPEYDHYDMWIIRVDSIGNMLWNNALGGKGQETSSKIFLNDNGTFTIFGTSGSPDGGDVNGHHFRPTYPNNPNDDIWMINLSAEGEVIDQRCFGNYLNARLRNGVIKKTDSNYLIAGSAYCYSEDVNGDIDCNHEPLNSEIWFFEILNCDDYTSVEPVMPIGLDTICSINTDRSIYTTILQNPKYDYADWLVDPSEAGSLVINNDTLEIIWNSTFEGNVMISVRAKNDCGTSSYSEVKQVQVYNCTGLLENSFYSLNIYPNPASAKITFELPVNTKKGTLHIVDIYGEKIAVFQIENGQTELVWDCDGVSSGTYIYQLENNGMFYRGKVNVLH